MIEAYNNVNGVSSVGKGSLPSFTKYRIEVFLPERIKEDLKGFYLKDIPDKAIITDKNFTDFDTWQGYFYF
jgi:hypothetical protein